MNSLQITREDFVEDVNSVVSAGEVPNMYTMEEQQALVNDLRSTLSTAEAQVRCQGFREHLYS